MIQRIRGLFILLHIFATLIIAAPALVHAGDIVVKPGKFDHFTISMPEVILAGQEVSVRLEAVDTFNNLISNFGETERDFQISSSGAAVIRPMSFKSSSFAGGVMTLAISDKAAETFNLSIRESGKPLPIFSKDITVLPNKLNAFVIKGPRIVQAGEPFDIHIIAKDLYGNTVMEPITGKNINLVFKGDADPKIASPTIPDFKSGAGVVTLVSQKSGSTIVEAKDLITGSSGNSERIDITSGPVNSFKIFAPKEVIAGEPFELSIVAVDRFNNVVSNYAKSGIGVVITSSGKLKPFPSTIPSYEFEKGQAKVDMRYDVAEDITLTVTEAGRNQTGSTDIVRVVSPIPERFEITTPDSVIAGQKFKIKITVYNQLGHVIKNYNLVGPDVYLSTTGTGVLVPNKIPSSEFVNGAAVVEVQYNKSEAFSIIASPLKTSTAQQAAQQQATVSESRPAVGAPTATAPAAKQAAKKEKKGKAKEEGKKESKKEKKGKEAKAKVKHQMEITNISLVESKKKSTLTIHIPNLDESVKYNVSSETIEGKKWVIVRVKPPVSKVEKSLKFDSSFIGNVMVEEEDKEKGTIMVKVELLKPTRFHVAREKNSIAVTLRP